MERGINVYGRQHGLPVHASLWSARRVAGSLNKIGLSSAHNILFINELKTIFF